MLLEAIAAHAKEHPDRIAYQNQEEKLSYRQLWERASTLSVWLKKESGPVMIFGEKEIGMPISFLACLMAARPYLPVDPGQATKRIEQIYQQSGARQSLPVGSIWQQKNWVPFFWERDTGNIMNQEKLVCRITLYGTPIGCLLREAPERPKVCEFLLLHWKILLDGCCLYRLLQNVVKGSRSISHSFPLIFR